MVLDYKYRPICQQINSTTASTVLLYGPEQSGLAALIEKECPGKNSYWVNQQECNTTKERQSLLNTLPGRQIDLVIAFIKRNELNNFVSLLQQVHEMVSPQARLLICLQNRQDRNSTFRHFFARSIFRSVVGNRLLSRTSKTDSDIIYTINNSLEKTGFTRVTLEHVLPSVNDPRLIVPPDAWDGIGHALRLVFKGKWFPIIQSWNWYAKFIRKYCSKIFEASVRYAAGDYYVFAQKTSGPLDDGCPHEFAAGVLHLHYPAVKQVISVFTSEKQLCLGMDKHGSPVAVAKMSQTNNDDLAVDDPFLKKSGIKRIIESAGKQTVMIEPWIPGKACKLAKHLECKAVLTWLRELQQEYSAGTFLAKDAQKYTEEAIAVLDRINLNDGMMLNAVLETVHRWADKACDKSLSLSICPEHGDFVPKNILITRDYKIAVVDSESWTAQGYPLYDPACLFLSSAAGDPVRSCSKRLGRALAGKDIPGNRLGVLVDNICSQYNIDRAMFLDFCVVALLRKIGSSYQERRDAVAALWRDYLEVFMRYHRREIIV